MMKLTPEEADKKIAKEKTAKHFDALAYEKQKIAFDLIDAVAIMLEELNGQEKNLPTNWQDYLKKSLLPASKGKNSSLKIRLRDLDIAKQVVGHQKTARAWKKSGRELAKDEMICAKEEAVAEAYGVDHRTIQRIKKNYSHIGEMQNIREMQELAKIHISITGDQDEYRNALANMEIPKESYDQDIALWLDDSKKILKKITHKNNELERIRH